MSGAFGFKRVPPPPPPPPRKLCLACKAFAAEVEVPVGEGAAPMCWMCAHLHVDHNVPVHETLTSEACECTPDKIYPHRDIGQGLLVGEDHPAVRFAHGDITHEGMMRQIVRDGGIRGVAYNHKTRQIEPFLIPIRSKN